MLLLFDLHDFLFGQPWYPPVVPASAVLAVVALLMVGWSLLKQRLTAIAFDGERGLASLSGLGRRSLRLERFVGYQRVAWGEIERGALRTTVGVACGLAFLALCAGTCICAVLLWGIQFGVREAELAEYLGNVVLYFFSLVVIPAPMGLLPLLYIQIAGSEGRLTLLERDQCSAIQKAMYGVIGLSVLGSSAELDVLEACLRAAHIPKLDDSVPARSNM